jgi:hypothetical protein
VINLSAAWDPPSESSCAWVRRFGRPSGIEPGDRVWLVVEPGDKAALVLNGICLVAASRRHDVTELLEPRNELILVPQTGGHGDQVAASSDDHSPGPSHGRRDLEARFGQVHLEISAGG